jgi:hypothetical protein
MAGDLMLVRVQKKSSPPRPLEVMRKLKSLIRQSPNKFLYMSDADVCHLQMDIKKLVVNTGNFFTRALFKAFSSTSKSNGSNGQEPEYTDLNLFFRIARAQIDVNVPTNYAREIERTTKKGPPKKTMIQMIYSGYDEFQTTLTLCEKNPMFRELMPYPDQGRIYIGFQTHQVRILCCTARISHGF